MWKQTSFLVLLLYCLFVKAQPQTAKQTSKFEASCMSEMPIPFSMSAMDTANARGLADRFYLWDNGSVLRVKFLNGSSAQAKKVMTTAKEWEKYANIKFVQVDSGDAEIRIKMGGSNFFYSRIGQLSLSVPQNEETMRLDTAYFYKSMDILPTVLHEFGHAIGLLHEHFSPNVKIQWDWDTLQREWGLNNFIGNDEILQEYIQTYSLSYTHGTKYDPKSIMHFPIKASWTKNGYSVPWNKELSEGDKVLVSMLYPKNESRLEGVPRLTVFDFNGINVVDNAEKKGLFFFPRFKIKNTGMSGKIYYVLMFYDASRSPIKDNDEIYNLGNIVATYKSFLFPSNTTESININSSRDFELYIPYSQLPTNDRAKMNVVFCVFVEDEGAAKLMYNTPFIPMEGKLKN